MSFAKLFLRRLALSLFLSMVAFVRLAYADSLVQQSNEQAQVILNQVQDAALKLNYRGLFAYQEGGVMQSLRIAHRFDGQNQQERLIELDDSPREYIRFNDVVQCLMPEQKVVIVESANSRRFPGFAAGDVQAALKNYTLWLDPKPHRVAGRVCQRYEVKPRDDFRRAFTLCVDKETNLLLKAQAINTEGRVIEQVSFSEVVIGGLIDDQAFQPSWSTEGWQVVERIQEPIDLSALGWIIQPAAGFYKQAQMQRMLSPDDWVQQVVLSDGLALMSIFIEPYRSSLSDPSGKPSGQLGSVNMLSKRIDNYWVTVLGEVPPTTLKEILNAIQYQPVTIQSESKR